MEENNKGKFTVAGIWPKLFGSSLNLDRYEPTPFSFEV
jgi:hypothetical protein